MCQALEELLLDLMKDQLDNREKQGITQGIFQGKQQKLLAQIRKKIEKGKEPEVIADELEETVDAILPLYNRVQTELAHTAL